MSCEEPTCHVFNVQALEDFPNLLFAVSPPSHRSIALHRVDIDHEPVHLPYRSQLVSLLRIATERTNQKAQSRDRYIEQQEGYNV